MKRFQVYSKSYTEPSEDPITLMLLETDDLSQAKDYLDFVSDTVSVDGLRGDWVIERGDGSLDITRFSIVDTFEQLEPESVC